MDWRLYFIDSIRIKMKVKDLLRHLSCYKPDDEIIALWWDRDSYYDYGFTVEEWNSIVQNLEKSRFEKRSQG